MSQDHAQSLAGEVVVFSLAGDEYALPIADVREIITGSAPRSIYSSLPWVRGVINLRNRIIPVCDLAVRLGKTADAGGSRKTVIVDSSAGTGGVIVDQVTEVLTLEEDQVDRLPAGGADCLSAVARLGDRLVVILDPDRLLEGIDGRSAGTAAPERLAA